MENVFLSSGIMLRGFFFYNFTFKPEDRLSFIKSSELEDFPALGGWGGGKVAPLGLLDINMCGGGGQGEALGQN